MNINKILIPTDLSKRSGSALPLAASLARDTGAELELLHVEEPRVVMAGTATAQVVVPPQHDEVHQMMDELVPAGTPINRNIVVGTPATAIVDFAKDHGIGLIVLTTHGRTGLTRMLMGSVAEAVVRNAPCPVLTIKDSDAAAASPPATAESAGDRV